MTAEPASRRALTAAIAVVAVVAIWQLVAAGLSTRAVIATPTSIVTTIAGSSGDWLALIGATAAPALGGLTAGAVAGIAIALVAAAVPAIERPALRVTAAIYGVPLVAIAPIVQVSLSAVSPSAVLAGLWSVFVITVAAIRGLRSAPPAILELAHSLGAAPPRIIVLIRARAAVPDLLSGLRIAWPAALTGSVIGEYVGGGDGLGGYLIEHAATAETAKVWAAATVITALATAGIGLIGVVLRRFTVPSRTDGAPPGESPRTGAASSPLTAVVVLLTLVLLWIAYLRLFQVTDFVARGPVQVVGYLRHGAGRDVLFGSLGVTLRDIALGIGIGWSSGAVLAGACCLSQTVTSALLPVVAGVHAIPVVAIVPLLTLMFGQNAGAVAVIVAVIAFFPTFILGLDGLRSAPADLIAIALSYSASPLAILARIRIPYAVPALVTGLRVSLPLAVTGALVAEWLASGQGVGHLMLTDATAYRYDRLWAASTLTTLIALTVFSACDALERSVRGRFGIFAR